MVISAAAFANDKLTSDADLVAGGLQQSYTNNSLADGATADFSFSLYVQVQSGGTEPTYPIQVDVESKPSWVSALTSFPVSISGTGTGNAVTVNFRATGQAAAASGDITFNALNSAGTAELSQSLIQTAQSTFGVSVSPPAITDTDGDGVADDDDSCPTVANADQADADSDGIGDVCEPDTDGDGVIDDLDNCPTVANTDQADADEDGLGNACDPNSYPPLVGTPAAADATGFEGDTLQTSGFFTDQDGNETLTITGTGVTQTSPADGTWSWSLATIDDTSGSVTVTASDAEHPDATDEFSYRAANVAPSISSASFGAAASCPTTPGANNINLTVTFSDAGSADTHFAEIDWDNNGTYEQTVDPYTSGTAIPHSYATAGTHTAKVRITDDDGGVSAVSSAIATVNYNLSSILQPINDTRNGQAASLFKYGSTIPVKVEVTACDGSHPTNLTLKVTWRQGLNATPDGVAEVVPTSQADLGNTMRYSDPLYVLQLNSKNTTSDSTSGVTIWVTIQETGQSTWANIGFRK